MAVVILRTLITYFHVVLIPIRRGMFYFWLNCHVLTLSRHGPKVNLTMPRTFDHFHMLLRVMCCMTAKDAV